MLIQSAMNILPLPDIGRVDRAVTTAKAVASSTGLVGSSPIMEQLRTRILQIARFRDALAFITGESGTGKELVANAIHRNSPRKEGPFVAVNCSTLNGELLLSALFGHSKGAFSGAIRETKGLFEQAHKGTLFLDEIDALSLEAQASLLRVIEDKKIRKLGSDGPATTVDVRIIVATANLTKLRDRNEFRHDLLNRILCNPITTPSLSERLEDIPELCKAFLKTNTVATEIQNDHGQISFSTSAIDRLKQHPWSGNIRELFNTLENTLISLPAGSKNVTAWNISFLQTANLNTSFAINNSDNFRNGANNEAPDLQRIALSLVGTKLLGLPYKDFMRLFESILIKEYQEQAAEAGLTKKDVAKVLGMNRSSIHKKLNSKT